MSVRLVIKMVQAPAAAAAAAPAEFPLEVERAATVAELKEQVAERSGMPRDHIRLVCAGRVWQDVATVASYEPRDGAVVHCLSNPPRATPAAAAQTPTAVSPMQALLGAGGLGPPAHASGDPMAQMMAQSQQMMLQNPEMMEQLMNSPMVQQMMSNPDTMRAMMRMNPQLNQLMEQRPEIARLLEDPEVLQQSMQMVRNPSLLREMQRNADRAIGQLDAMPGGHSALLRAHEEMVDPLMAALTGSNQDSAPTELPTYSQPTEGGPNSSALPNPWGAPSAAAAAPPAAAPPAARPAAGVGVQTGAAASPAANPMAAMMQQMMSNPAMLQQSMQMARLLGQGPGMGLGGTLAPTPAPATSPATTIASPGQVANPFAAMMMGMQPGSAPQAGMNPTAAIMQQMMQNPALMQQSMLMAQQMMGRGQGMGFGGVPAFGAPIGAQSPISAQATSPSPQVPLATQSQDVTNPYVRARFAAQLAQLSAMGFCNEAACLRALVQHQGRIDAAIDMLLSSGDGGSA